MTIPKKIISKHMINKLKKWVVNSGLFKNHKFLPVAPDDVRSLKNDPRLLNYTNKQSILIDAKITHGRIAQIFALDYKVNPFVRTIREALKSEHDSREEVIFGYLNEYYSAVQPKNGLDWYGLKNEDAPQLENLKAWMVPTPWSYRSVEETTKNVKKWLSEDNYQIHKSVTIDDGFTFFGPVSDVKIEIESKRYAKLLESIEKKGYNRSNESDGDIEGGILINSNNDWRIIVNGGQHRAIVLAALGYETIPVRVSRNVYEAEVNYWPNVISGLYTKKGALKLFKTIFDGDASHLT